MQKIIFNKLKFQIRIQMEIMFLLKMIQQAILQAFTRTICEVSWAELDSFKN